MTVADFFDYLLDRQETQDLAMQLASVYEARRSRALPVGAVR